MTPSLNGKPLHFLVVDDDDASRASIVEYLEALGFNKITTAKNGTEGVKALEKDSSINFIISDWDMPQMNGLAFLQKVRSNAARSSIPFLIATSPISDEAEKIVLAAENMVDAYIIKPFRSHTLKEKLDRLLAQSVHGPQKTVVVVDDDPDAQTMLVEYMKNLGFKDVRTFSEGRAALDFLHQSASKVSLIVSDWEMPQMNGVELLRACKIHPKLSEVPFLMVTSQSSMERMKILQAAKANVDTYLLKPFNSADLKERVDELLQKSGVRGQVQKLLAEGMEHMESGRYPAAGAMFEQAAKLDPENDVALRGLGDAVAKVKGQEAAMPFYKKAIEANPFNMKGYLKLAAAYEQLNWHDKAILLLESANQQITFNSELHFQLGRLLYKKEKYAQARAEFEKTLELQLDHQEARLLLELMNTQKLGEDESSEEKNGNKNKGR